MSALSSKQKRILSQMSDAAFNFLGAKARGAGQPWPEGNTAERTRFRHEHVARACHKQGLRCCDQNDYATVKAHFQSLLGHEGHALNTLLHGDDNQRRQAEWLVAEECRKQGLSHDYAAGICRRMFHGLSIREASREQLFKVFKALRYHRPKTT